MRRFAPVVAGSGWDDFTSSKWALRSVRSVSVKLYQLATRSDNTAPWRFYYRMAIKGRSFFPSSAVTREGRSSIEFATHQPKLVLARRAVSSYPPSVGRLAELSSM